MKLIRTVNVLITAVVTIAVASSVAASVARAEAGAVLVYGKARPHERQVVAAAVTRTVHEASWSITGAAFTAKEAESVIGCLTFDRPWPCVAPTAAARGIQRVVVVQVELESAGSIVVTGQVLLDTSAVPSIERRYCDPCSDPTLDQSARELTRVLLERTIARAGNTAIEIHTIPPGASIAIDGNMAGSSDKTIAVAAGPHEVQLQRSGFRPHSEQVTVAEGTTYRLSARLTAFGPGAAAREARPSRLVPALVGGAGALAVLGGTVSSLRVDPPGSFDQPRYLYSGPALAVAAAGAVAVGVAVYLWLHHPQPRSAPSAAATRAGGVVGWSTSF